MSLVYIFTLYFAKLYDFDLIIVRVEYGNALKKLNDIIFK